MHGLLGRGRVDGLPQQRWRRDRPLYLQGGPIMSREENCPGCVATPGSSHGEDCDHAACPDCGEQLFMHDCEHWPEDAEGPDRPALWHGIDPRAEVARTLNWWTTATVIDHLVEDYTRVLFATVLGQVTWDPQAQRYVIGQVDDAELDRAIANSHPW